MRPTTPVLVEHVEVFAELADDKAAPDGVLVEAVWAMPLLSYARCSSPRESGASLTEEDLTAASRTVTCRSGIRCCSSCATTTVSPP